MRALNGSRTLSDIFSYHYWYFQRNASFMDDAYTTYYTYLHVLCGYSRWMAHAQTVCADDTILTNIVCFYGQDKYGRCVYIRKYPHAYMYMY